MPMEGLEEALGVWDAVPAALPPPEAGDEDVGEEEKAVDVVGWRYQSGRKGRHEPETLRSGRLTCLQEYAKASNHSGTSH